MTDPAASGVSIAIVRNPLQPERRELHEAFAGEWLIDWLQDNYPKGFGAGITLARNGREIEIADADFPMEAGDVITIVVHPGGQIIGALILKAIVSAAIAAATNLIFNLIFGRPKGPASHDTPGPDPIYTISGAQNAARLGEPIPVLYGKMVSVPDYGSQPYTYFDGNNQYLAQILVIGWGIYDLNEVRVGETPVSALESNAVTSWLMGPGDHQQVMGRIEAMTGVMENVVSSPEVADQELSGEPSGDVIDHGEPNAKFDSPNRLNNVANEPPAGYGWVRVTGSDNNNRSFSINSVVLTSPGRWRIVFNESVIPEDPDDAMNLRYYKTPDSLDAGPFITSKPGANGDRIMCDFVFPGGLYEIDDESGDFLPLSVSFEILYQQVDDAGNPIGGYISHPVYVTRNTNTPVRFTESIDVAPGRYRVKLHRTSPPPANSSQTNNFIWTGLKFRLLNRAGPVYGSTSLLVMRIRATNGIAGAASSRVSVDVTRWLYRLGDGPIGPSRSPADAFIDVYTNVGYGARRPMSEVDKAEIARLEANWQGAAHFDGGFAQRSTVWEALTLTLQTAAAAPLPLGQLMSAAQDGTKAIRTQMFSDANMVKGSLSIGYSFDKPGDPDGIRVEYRDPATWNSLYALYPPAALDPDPITLFGCTDGGQALGFAKLLWQKRMAQRKTAQFETELEGLIPRLGDRIAVATQLPRWARAGIISGYSGQQLRLDAATEWPDDWATQGWMIVLRNQYGVPSDPIPVSPGPGPYDVILATPAPFQLFGTGSQEPTHYALGTSTESVADFTIANIEHRGGDSVAVEAINYDPSVFVGTLPWLERPI